MAVRISAIVYIQNQHDHLRGPVSQNGLQVNQTVLHLACIMAKNSIAALLPRATDLRQHL